MSRCGSHRGSQLVLLTIICGFISALFTGNASVQSLSDSCFPHKTLHTVVPVEIRRRNSHFSGAVGKTTLNKTYTVYQVYKAPLFGSCWIKISDGWILRRAENSAIKPGSREQRTTRTSTTTPPIVAVTRCYTSRKAYITGTMNIRSGPSTSNNKVGSANAGDSFTVSGSHDGEDYCWLEISKGWIAKTGRVQSTKPVVPADEVTYPSIVGSEAFVNDVKRAFRYLASNSANWYSYVRSVTRSIESSEATIGARAYTKSRHMEINPNHSLDTMELASVLIHEACHFYQAIQGRLDSLSRLHRETECVRIQIDFVEEVSPNSTGWINRVRSYLSSSAF